MKYIEERPNTEVILILGLPGSGKTTIADKIAEGSNKDYVRYDDFAYYTIAEKIGKEDIIISDTMLIVPSTLKQFKQHFKGKDTKLKIFYFKNDLTQCIENVKKRWERMSDEEKRKNSHKNPSNLISEMTHFSSQYEIPSGAYQIPVFKVR